jgi:hypothetical protein
VPPSDTNNAMPAITIDGDGREIFMYCLPWDRLTQVSLCPETRLSRRRCGLKA